jgi:hypothetical protein
MVTLFSLAQEIAERVINSGAYHCRDMADEIDSVLRNHVVEDDDGQWLIEIEKEGE